MTHEQVKSIFFTKKTLEELSKLVEAYGENRSRLINRLINNAYQDLRKAKKGE